MSETMTVYFASRTGHVLGALTRAAGVVPEAPRAASLEDLLVRGGFKVPLSPATPFPASFPGFLVSLQDLSTLVLAPDLGVVQIPLHFQVLAQTDVVQPMTRSVKELSVTLIPTNGTTEVKVTVNDPVAEDEPVWIQIIGGVLTAPRIVIGTIPRAAGIFGTLKLEFLTPGIYQILVLVRGHLSFAETKTI